MDAGGHMQLGKSINQKTNQKHKARRRSPSQICVLPSERQQSKQRTGQEPNQKNHKRFAETQWKKSTVSQEAQKHATNELVATQKRETSELILLPRGQQKSHLLYTVD